VSEGYKYDWSGINPDSTVVDIGGFEGAWSAEIAHRYNPRILCFEPILGFYDQCRNRLEKFPKVEVYHNGIGGESGQATFMVSGDSTGAFNKNPAATPEKVNLLGIVNMLELFKLDKIQCLKINAEGAEFSILETILKNGLAKRFEGILVQPHTVVPDYEARWSAIEAGLAETHTRTFHKKFVWERWMIK